MFFSKWIPNDFVIHFNLMFSIQNMSLKSFRSHGVRHPFLPFPGFDAFAAAGERQMLEGEFYT